jgi:hypothetical protein
VCIKSDQLTQKINIDFCRLNLMLYDAFQGIINVTKETANEMPKSSDESENNTDEKSKN